MTPPAPDRPSPVAPRPATLLWPRMMRSLLACVALGMLALACSRPEPEKRTLDELRAGVEAYQRGDAGVTEERLNALFARLEADVAALRADEAEATPPERPPLTARREALEAEGRRLQGEYLNARVARLGEAAGDALRSVGEQIGQGLEEAGRRMREAARTGKAEGE